jgi:hypothetical protein
VIFVEPNAVYASRASSNPKAHAFSHPAITEFHDGRISYFMRHHAGAAVPVWEMINHIVSLDRPASEPERRRITLVVLDRLKALLKARFLVRCGRKHVALAGVPVQNPPLSRPRFFKRRTRKQLSVRHTRRTSTVHVPASPEQTAQNTSEPGQTPDATGCAVQPFSDVHDRKTESGVDGPTAIQLRQAAIELANLPRHPKRTWTGWANGTHLWRGRRVILPNGEVREVYGAVRNSVALVPAPGEPLDPPKLLYRTDQVRVWKHPAAQALGHAKRGVRERKSDHKAATARKNGCCPVRPGRQPRGRPKSRR